VSALLGDGSGGLVSAGSFSTGGKKPQDLVLSDFNQDTDMDIAVVNLKSDTASFLAGNGDGTFGLPVKFAVGSKPASIATDDFNNDGFADIAVANQDSGNISVLLGNGTGAPQFQEQLRIHYPGKKEAVSIAAGDFDLDGNADLALANQKNNTFSLLLGAGTGTFSEPADFSVGDVQKEQPVSIAVADLNGDSFPDVVVVNAGTDDVSVLLRNI
jgi:hypothetical protein